MHYTQHFDREQQAFRSRFRIFQARVITDYLNTL